jgi:hypothetical protein
MTVNRIASSSKILAALALPALVVALGGCGRAAPARDVLAGEPEAAGTSSAAAPASIGADDAPRAAAAPDVRRLIALGNAAFREGRLFEPVGDSAIDHVAAAHAIDPADPAVREAVSDLLPLALARAEAVIVRGPRQDAARLLDRVDRLSPGSPAIAALRNRLAAAIRADAEAAARLTEREAPHATAEPAVAAADPTGPTDGDADATPASAVPIDPVVLERPAPRPVGLADLGPR